jgi:hypothetical protein
VHDVRADGAKPSVSPASDEAEAAERREDENAPMLFIKRFLFPFL